MRDDEAQKDWKKLLNASNIDVSTKYIWRLSVALHIAFMLRFMQTLSQNYSVSLLQEMKENRQEELAEKWDVTFEDYMNTGT